MNVSIKQLVIANTILLGIAGWLWLSPGKSPDSHGIIITDYWGEPVIVTMDPFTIQTLDCRLDFNSREELIPAITNTRGKALWLHETFPAYRFPGWLCNTHFWILNNFSDTIGYGINNPATDYLNLTFYEEADTTRQ